MWRTKRQTKKHRTKNRPKLIAQMTYYLIGIVAIFFVVLSAFSLTRQTPLIIPVSRLGNIKGILQPSVSGTEAIEKALKSRNIHYLFVTTATNSAVIVTMPGNAEVIMQNKNIPEQIASLQLITDRLTMEGKRFRRLDLRFDRPVVVLAN